jgi:hypothetical protein
MKRITLRTKITLTTAGLLALAGIFYAANPTSFSSSISQPVGVAASKTDLIVTPYCSQNVNTIDCFGNVSLLATIPGGGGCLERYIAIAPAQSKTAGFTPRDIFVTQGDTVYKVSESTVTQFATIPGCGYDHTGIAFDHVGTSGFGFNMIVTCNSGGVWEVDSSGSPTPIANVADTVGEVEMEGPAIPPLSFGRLGGQILVADEENGAVHAIGSNGIVTPYVFNWDGAEAVVVIPSGACKFCNDDAGPGAYFQVIQNSGAIY